MGDGYLAEVVAQIARSHRRSASNLVWTASVEANASQLQLGSRIAVSLADTHPPMVGTGAVQSVATLGS